MSARTTSPASSPACPRSMSALPDPDRAALAEAGLAQAYLEDLRTALQQGPRGAVTDMALMASPWGCAQG